MSKLEARIECVVGRPFFYYDRYDVGDIFPYNPNNLQHVKWLRSKRIYQLQEDAYEYVFVADFKKELFGSFYEYNEIVNVKDVPEKAIEIQIKRGCLRKRIKKNAQNDFTYGEYAKSKSVTYKELKNLYKARFDEYLPHHMTKVDTDIFSKMKLLFPEVAVTYQNLCDELNITFEELKRLCKDNFSLFLPNPDDEISQDLVKKVKEVLK